MSVRMRLSTTVLTIVCAASGCATSQDIDLVSRGASGFPIRDAGVPESNAPNGSGGFISTGGLPSTGGSQATGGRPATGGQGTGGVSRGSGGVVGTGGTPPTGGSSNGGTGTGGMVTCTASEKVCNGACVSPGPANGCTLTDCTPCSPPAPAHGVLVCNQGKCDFNCQSGFNKSGNTCVAPPVYCQGSDGGVDGGPCKNSCPLSGSTQCCTGRKQCGCTANLGLLLCL
jgi:hypothetical protein